VAPEQLKHLENCFEKPAGMRVKKLPLRIKWPIEVTPEDERDMIENSGLGLFWRDI
jgi:hypothetical protein